jgi:CheY-like chemotaxis protein
MPSRFSLGKSSDCARRQLSVLNAGSLGPCFTNLFRVLVRAALDQEVQVRVTACEKMPELLGALASRDFDLVFLHLYSVGGPMYEELEAAELMPTWMRTAGTRRSGYISLQGRAIIGILGRAHGFPVIVVESCGLDHEAALLSGAQSCLSLPFKIDEISTAIRRCLRW